MILRQHSSADALSTAVYSPDETFRYALTRVWDETAPRVLFVMLNPSTATEAQNDPTVERCERRARAMGFGAFRVVNLFGFRATDPKAMRAAADPIGPANDATLQESAQDWACGQEDLLICAWGTHGAHRNRSAAVEALLRATGRQLFHLGLTQAGHPAHPLYLPYNRQPRLWS